LRDAALTHELIEDGTTTDAPAVDIDAVLTAHLRRTLGTWPPLAPLAVVSAPARDGGTGRSGR